jgi:hypothetical protein
LGSTLRSSIASTGQQAQSAKEGFGQFRSQFGQDIGQAREGVQSGIQQRLQEAEQGRQTYDEQLGRIRSGDIGQQAQALYEQGVISDTDRDYLQRAATTGRDLSSLSLEDIQNFYSGTGPENVTFAGVADPNELAQIYALQRLSQDQTAQLTPDTEYRAGAGQFDLGRFESEAIAKAGGQDYNSLRDAYFAPRGERSVTQPPGTSVNQYIANLQTALRPENVYSAGGQSYTMVPGSSAELPVSQVQEALGNVTQLMNQFRR